MPNLSDPLNQQPYELFVFARRHRIALERARYIIARFGSDRPGSDAAAVTGEKGEVERVPES